MKSLTPEQRLILRNILNDCAMIYIESKENEILRSDEEFTNDVDSIIISLKHLLGDADNGRYGFEFITVMLHRFLNDIAEIRDTYDKYSYGYPTLNSFYDVLREGYIELAQTI